MHLGKPVTVSRTVGIQLLRRGRAVSDTGCIEWTRAVNSKGYPVVRKSWKSQSPSICLVHRIISAAFHGPLARAESVDHVCGNCRCINPRHLEPVSFSLNRQRQWERENVAPF